MSFKKLASEYSNIYRYKKEKFITNRKFKDNIVYFLM